MLACHRLRTSDLEYAKKKEEAITSIIMILLDAMTEK
jgi:hypothetical protein